MYFEINISLNGDHYFATAKRSITTAKKAAAVILDLRKRFPAKEGYEISVTCYHEVGYGCEIGSDHHKNPSGILGICEQLADKEC